MVAAAAGSTCGHGGCTLVKEVDSYSGGMPGRCSWGSCTWRTFCDDGRNVYLQSEVARSSAAEASRSTALAATVSPVGGATGTQLKGQWQRCCHNGGARVGCGCGCDRSNTERLQDWLAIRGRGSAEVCSSSSDGAVHVYTTHGNLDMLPLLGTFWELTGTHHTWW